MRLWVAAGGTAGHLLAGAAVLEAAPPEVERMLVVSDRPLDRRLAGELAMGPTVAVAGTGLARDPRRALAGIARNLSVVPSNVATLRGLSAPDVVLTLGGFHTPLVAAIGRARGARVALLEQNAVLGRANQVIAPLAERLLLAWPLELPASYRARALVVGNPVREVVRRAIDRDRARRHLGIGEDELLVTVTSGSLGARAVNEALVGALESLVRGREGLRVWHAMGAHNAVSAPTGVEGYVAREFWPDLFEVIAASDLVVARAGASTLTELALAGVASVLVPLPNAPRDHQRRNAAIFVEAGAAVLLEERELTPSRLGGVVGELLDDPERRARMGMAAKGLANPGAAGMIYEELVALWLD